MAYFNYSIQRPADGWARRSFLSAWRRIYADDPRWPPPEDATWRRLVIRMDSPYWQRIIVQPIVLEALPQRRQSPHAPMTQPLLAGAVFEEAVAASLLFCAPEHNGAAYLGMLHCVNDEETLDRLLSVAMECAADAGCFRLVGPTGITPSWECGALINYFHELPPAHTPYNPPYLAELLNTSMSICQESSLYVLPVSGVQEPLEGPAELAPLELATHAKLLPTLIELALAPHVDGGSVDPDEAGLLLRWLATAPLCGWIACINGEPVGFAAVQPDLAPLRRRTGGGKSLPWRWYASWAMRRPAQRGRLLFGCVAPAWRRQGIGRQLLAAAQSYAARAGWRELVCGPYVEATSASAVLRNAGGRVQQRYQLFEWSG